MLFRVKARFEKLITCETIESAITCAKEYAAMSTCRFADVLDEGGKYLYTFYSNVDSTEVHMVDHSIVQ
jgi:hypothetical protein